MKNGMEKGNYIMKMDKQLLKVIFLIVYVKDMEQNIMKMVIQNMKENLKIINTLDLVKNILEMEI